MARRWDGPPSGVGSECTALAPGVWLTTGRAAVVEGPDHLAVIDPGDEPCGSPGALEGPLADALALTRRTGKPLRWVLLTHAHPDHVANLAAFRAVVSVRVAAHARCPLGPDLAVTRESPLEIGSGLVALPTPGHSAEGDDLSFWLPRERILFSGDLVQPKGEIWEETFFPSPWVFFTDAELYLASMARLAALPFETLVTGHREVRRGEEARRWVELTARSIRAVGEHVATWEGPDDLRVAGPAIYRSLAAERGLPADLVDARLAPEAGPASAFARYDLPGIAWFWERRRVRPPR